MLTLLYVPAINSNLHCVAVIFVGSLACIGTLIATAIFTAAVCPSLPLSADGTPTATSLAPLNVGYGLMFRVDPATTLAVCVTQLTLPYQYLPINK